MHNDKSVRASQSIEKFSSRIHDLEDTGLASRREEYPHPSVAQASKECSLIKVLVKLETD